MTASWWIIAAALAAAAALGSLPTGAAVGRRLRGLDLRRYSPHNLGLGTVLAAAGLPAVVLSVLLDLTKGALAVAVAAWLRVPDWALAAGAAAALAGHAYAPSWNLRTPAPARLKGVAVAAGAVVTLATLDRIAWAAAAGPAALAGAALALPRVLGGRWGYLSVAAVAAAAGLPAALWVTGAPGPFLVAALAYCLVTIWNHKEHLARIADGLEPRLAERLPLPALDGGEAVCAFLIHPMSVDDLWAANRFRWLAPLHRRGILAEGTVRVLSRLMRPMKVDDLYPIVTADGRRARAYLIGVPLLPDQIRAQPELAVRRAVQAAHLAESLGATVIGLGAYWSVVGDKGREVAVRSRIAVTNGGAYTAGTVRMAVPLILDRLRARGGDPARATVAVVGANGVVGFGICRQVAGHVRRLIMVGTDQTRLERSRELLQGRHPGLQIEATTAYDALRDADAIFTATSAPGPVIFPQHVREGCLLIDLGRPPDVHDAVKDLPGVEVIPGGVIRLPGAPRARLDLGYGPGLVPACLAEALIIALDGAHDRASLGDRTRSEHIDYFVARGAALGFEVVTGASAPARAGAADIHGAAVLA